VTQDASPRQSGRLLLLAPLLTCGCVGYATVLPRDSEVEELASTPEQLERERGAPDEKRVQNGDEVWEYESSGSATRHSSPRARGRSRLTRTTAVS
jgi:hypothetical protein